MKKILLFTLIICALHSVLIVNQDWGINVILMSIPLIISIIYLLRENKCIINKKGLLWGIPILLLSSTYFIYDGTMKYLNVFVIPILYIFMYVYTMKPVDRISDIVIELLNLIVKPINYIAEFFSKANKIIWKDKKLSPQTKKVLKSILLVLPIIIFVLYLLTSADSIFDNLFRQLFSFKISSLDEIIYRVFVFVLLFIYLGSTLFFLVNYYGKEEMVKKEKKLKDPLTMNILLVSLNIIYVIFDIIQINSLLLHRVSSGFNYADYARSGFFQLMLISIINITIVLLSKKRKEQTKTKVMSIIMILLTYIILMSSFYRMFLYEQAYGYTVLRLGVYAILITEGILLIPTIMYIIDKKINIINCYITISMIVYLIINCFSVDRIIAQNNTNRYLRTGKIDIYYLENGNYDNLNQLRFLSEKLEEDYQITEMDKANLKAYIETKDKQNKFNYLEYNLSKEKAKKRD